MTNSKINETEKYIDKMVEAGVVNALTRLGLTAGEITQRQAFKVYGRGYITQLVENGRIYQKRRSGEKGGTIRYSVEEILKCIATDRMLAELL